MAKIKTTETSKSVTDFVNAVANEVKRKDSFEIINMMQELTGFEPKMWGPSIIGFGNYHYKYDSGHEGDMPVLAFSPRLTAIVVYACENFTDKEALMKKLGKHTSGKVCIYIKKLADINVAVLKKILVNSLKQVQMLYLNKVAK